MAFSYFFRDMQILETIRDHVVPTMRTRRFVTIWDAGCAMGQEPYSLAMLLRENMGPMIFRNIKIVASDIDLNDQFGPIITQGCYPLDDIKRIPDLYRERYFTPDAAQQMRIADELRQCVRFHKHDLLTCTPLASGCLLILCKNVLLHFHEHERIAVLRMFHAALADDGYLALEHTQKLPTEVAHLFQSVTTNTQLFRKCPGTAG